MSRLLQFAMILGTDVVTFAFAAQNLSFGMRLASTAFAFQGSKKGDLWIQAWDFVVLGRISGPRFESLCDTLDIHMWFSSCLLQVALLHDFGV